MEKIIVYLDEYLYSGNNCYEFLLLDFRTRDDYYRYTEAMNIRPKEGQGSFIVIHRYRSQKRLVQGAYYSLNLEVLRQVPSRQIERSYLIGQSYDFNLEEVGGEKGISLLQSHQPLNPNDLAVPSIESIKSFDELYTPDDLEFHIKYVGQANWNEIRQKGTVRIVYDIGAPTNASRFCVHDLICRYTSQYKQDRPCLILSHWDKDHYHCLLGMADAEIQNFSKLICVDKIMSNTATSLYQRLERILGGNNIICIKPPNRTPDTDYPLMHEVYSNSAVHFYNGEASKNVNYSGLVLLAKGNQGHILLTGDCLPCQANYVLHQIHNAHDLNSDHYFLVPHHGGDFKGKSVYKTYKIPYGVTAKEAIISVDQDWNIYGHPAPAMLDWLDSVANWNIVRTDQEGTVRRPL